MVVPSSVQMGVGDLGDMSGGYWPIGKLLRAEGHAQALAELVCSGVALVERAAAGNAVGNASEDFLAFFCSSTPAVHGHDQV